MKIRPLLLRTLEAPGVAETLSALTGTAAVIFMLHRFAVPELGIDGDDPEELRRVLGHLRKRRFDLISVAEVFRRLKSGEPLRRAVAFSLDDGYFEQARVAGPIFAEFDCPATVFAVTGFLDGTIWLWPDKIRYIFEAGHVPSSALLEFGTAWLKQSGRPTDWYDLAVCATDLTEEDRQAFIRGLSESAGVELPSRPPDRFASFSWDEARGLEKRGVTLGPHTVTHPVLSKTRPEQAEFEVVESWRRLVGEVKQPVPVFSYPSGGPNEFGEREAEMVRRAGLAGAVTSEARHISPGKDTLFRIPRHGYSGLASVLQCISGAENLKAQVRARLRPALSSG